MSRLPDRTAISPILLADAGPLALLLAVAGLSACDIRMGGAQGCAERFPDAIAALGRDPMRSTIRYGFELSNPDPALLRDGIEGLPPSPIVAITGTDSRALAEAEVVRRLDPASPPGLVHIRAEPASWLVYIPTRAVSATEGRRQLGAMCTLSSRGALLRRVSVSPGTGK